MKPVLFLAALFIVSSALGQRTPYSGIQERYKKKSGKVIFPPSPPAIMAPTAGLPSIVVPSQLPNGNTVLILPQDRMPCVVPDMSQFNMPSTGSISQKPSRYKGPGAIPNPSDSLKLD